MTQNGGQNFDSSSRALGAFDQRGPYGILIHLGVDFLKMNESQFRAENPAAKYPLPYSQQLLNNKTIFAGDWHTAYVLLYGPRKLPKDFKKPSEQEDSKTNEEKMET